MSNKKPQKEEEFPSTFDIPCSIFCGYKKLSQGLFSSAPCVRFMPWSAFEDRDLSVFTSSIRFLLGHLDAQFFGFLRRLL